MSTALTVTRPARRSRVRLIQSTLEDFWQDYRGPRFHALLCDPPYHLTSIVKRFGKPGSAPARTTEFFDGGGNSKGASPYARASRGFMGKNWDGGDVAFRPETWAYNLSLLYPGGFGMAFSSSRSWHRLATAIEDAGAIIHPSIFGWGFGSGFPKATRIAGDPEGLFVGHRYGAQALKPALEPIIVFQRPYEGRPVDNILDSGAGALWIDGARVEAEPDGRTHKIKIASEFGASPYVAGMRLTSTLNIGTTDEGRWPANLVLIHDPACGDRCVAGCPVAELDAQTGDRPGGGHVNGGSPKPTQGILGDFGIHKPFAKYDDYGTASRYFFNANWSLEVAEQLDNAALLYYAAKVAEDEREAGLEDFPLIEAADLTDRDPDSAGLVGNAEKGFDHNPLAKVTTARRNQHPTLKPILLTTWLATLLLPPPQYGPRRLFVPFAGSGSEVIGGMRAGFEEVVGVERDPVYAKIGQARIKYHKALPRQLVLFKPETAKPAAAPVESPARQTSLL